MADTIYKPIPRQGRISTVLLPILLIVAMSAAAILAVAPRGAAAAGLLPDHLFPMVNITITNNATHEVWYLCNNEQGQAHGHDRLFYLGPGDMTQWAVRDMAFPLVWCYMHLNDDLQGVFWAFHAKYRCDRHCDWWVQDYGLFLHTRFDKGQYIWLYQEGEFF